MTDYLPCTEINPPSLATATVIWLHGLGADGDDFVPVIPALNLPADHGIRFVLPHAPTMGVTINNGMVMPAWYDVTNFDGKRGYNHEDLLASALAVQALIDREITRGVPSNRIMLIGFSQGGAVNYQAALTYSKPLAGMLALSTYFPTHASTALNPANAGLPVLICHGSGDPLLPISMASSARKALETLGLAPQFRSYFMGHELCGEEVVDIASFITANL
jgi:phospholipase/carboxylesterase